MEFGDEEPNIDFRHVDTLGMPKGSRAYRWLKGSGGGLPADYGTSLQNLSTWSCDREVTCHRSIRPPPFGDVRVAWEQEKLSVMKTKIKRNVKLKKWSIGKKLRQSKNDKKSGIRKHGSIPRPWESGWDQKAGGQIPSWAENAFWCEDVVEMI